ncbi:hypothetical protein JOL79_06840 [Microbispora sp. RL4-1S]|uniref:Uncharacterized protein n=1 Tax=Microbispora oryzae TaxID=2806554 RepID=A0A941APB0_9ACTN|nr:hypothetical protein [Microbispora oryzae]MBP2703514.1 hypothetical protein [Microbispora oryzae]
MRITGDPGPLDLAEVAYRAYGGFTDWTNYAGNPMPSWRELPAPQRNAWVAAAEAVQQVLVEGRAPSWGAGPRSAYEASHPEDLECLGPQHPESSPAPGSNRGGRA